MHDLSIMLILVILSSLLFDYINGFHDTANAIATVVSTRVLSPRTAIYMAAGLNLVGALIATHVAKTISDGLVGQDVSNSVVLSAVVGAIIWNIITWKFGIPSSSSHALIGGLVGAAIVGHHVVLWNGVITKVAIPLVASPILGFILGYGVMWLTSRAMWHKHPGRVSHLFRRLQVFSAAAMAFGHGSNDAQKSMGIITLALISMGALPKGSGVPLWVKLACAVAMALGTSAGGWRIIKTMGHKIIRLEPVHGFAAETSAATVIFGASFLGMPVSTTHVIAGSIFGVGSSKRFSAVRWGVAQSMIVAWVITLPASALFGAICVWCLRTCGLK
jgi:PiT family inorganic phosphate transporter